MKTNVKKRTSILSRILIMSMQIITIIVCIIFAESIFNMRKELKNSIDETLKNTTLESTMYTSNWICELKYMLKTVKNSLENIKFYSDATELQYLQTTVELHKSCPYGVYGGDANGLYLDGSGWVPDADYVVTERDWYKDGVESDEVVLGMPYLDAQTGDIIVSASVKLNRPDRNKMVIAADVFLTDVTNELKERKVLN